MFKKKLYSATFSLDTDVWKTLTRHSLLCHGYHSTRASHVVSAKWG